MVRSVRAWGWKEISMHRYFRIVPSATLSGFRGILDVSSDVCTIKTQIYPSEVDEFQQYLQSNAGASEISPIR